jgi:hypothetical protein
LPDLLLVLVDQPEPVTAVVVRVAETGGEILVAGPDARPVVAEQVEGSDPKGQVPADAALLRAAAGTAAGFVPIGGGRAPGGPGHPIDDGVGALLRYPLPTGA